MFTRLGCVTQEILDACGQHGIAAGIEMIRMEGIESAYGRMQEAA